MIDDFDRRWGDGTHINKYTLGTNSTNKGQPCGYTKGQVLCFTLDPRMVTLPQVDEDQEEAVWRVLEIKCKETMQGRRSFGGPRWVIGGSPIFGRHPWVPAEN